MKQENLAYLVKQIKYLGFGDMETALSENMAKAEKSFQLLHKANFGENKTDTMLHIQQAKDSDRYYLNNYQMNLTKGQQNEVISQTYYIDGRTNNKELKNANNYTLKEAYNLLDGRCVNKDFTNKAGELYNSWAKINFTDIDPNGNYGIKKSSFEIEDKLEAANKKLSIVEMGTDEDRDYLIQSLKKGNRQSVEIEIDGKKDKIYIEANWAKKSLSFYDDKGLSLDIHAMTNKEKDTPVQSQAEGKSQKEEQKKKDDDDGDKKQKNQQRRNSPKPS